VPGRLGKTTNGPDDVVGQQTLDERQSTWGEIPGKVVDFDPATQTATIQPLYKPRHNGKAVDMPQLYEVPVRMARAGKGGMTYPVAAGDYVTLRPQMRSGENYHSEEKGESSDARSFSVSDMEAHLEGGESLKNPIKNFDASNVHVRFDEEGNYGIRGSSSGKIKIEGSEGNIYAIIAEFMELVASDELMISYGSSAGSGHALKNRGQLMALAAKIRAMAL
jgi:hypothetical protein